ncbi:MAG: Arc family DNA-binding protein [Planctomycetes bacterium]|nr:Arc family DNA-binding protein [Planctomycetota bacterium]
MAQILVRDLDDGVVEKLKTRARLEGRSLQSEAKMILEQAARVDMEAALRLVDDFRKRFRGRKFSDSAELIRKDRDR